ncbi:MAG TPA: CvpA family protein [Candidatus Onthovicinus excrementipullorum]|nr:CvpA family protein [Candidatus Onthovicinus excrementipullorum]
MKKLSIGDGRLGLVFDICLVLIFVLMICLGVYKGAVRTVLGIIALVLAGFLAVKLGSYLAPLIYDKFFSESIAAAIQSNLPDEGTAISAAQQAQSAMESLPDFVRNMAASFGINLNEIQAQISSYDYSGADIAQNIEGSVIAPLVTAVCKVIVVIVAFLLLYIIFRLLICLIDRFFDLPVLGTANRILGGILGAVKGLIAVVLVSFLIEAVVALFFDPGSSAAQGVSDSRVIALLDPYNPIGTLF